MALQISKHPLPKKNPLPASDFPLVRAVTLEVTGPVSNLNSRVTPDDSHPLKATSHGI